MQVKEIRELSNEELMKKDFAFREDYFRLRFRASTAPMEK